MEHGISPWNVYIYEQRISLWECYILNIEFILWNYYFFHRFLSSIVIITLNKAISIIFFKKTLTFEKNIFFMTNKAFFIKKDYKL